jgi:hypothetical protein
MKNQKMFIRIMAAVMVGALLLPMLAYIFT